MSILDILRKKEPLEVLHYVVLVEAPLNIVGAQLKQWYEDAWRPASRMSFKNLTNEELRAGSKFVGTFKSPWPTSWNLEVMKFNSSAFLQSNITGFFKGTETISVEERFNAIKVDYDLRYEIGNPFSQMVWSVFLEDKFVKEIRQMMEAFKTNCEKAKA